MKYAAEINQRGRSCDAACAQKVHVVTGVDDAGSPTLREETIDALLHVLWRRTDRLIDDSHIAKRLKQLLGQFVCNVVSHFARNGELDRYVYANILAALVTADNHGRARHGVEDYSTFVRRPNPTQVDADRYFIIGRSGKVSDTDCPLNAIGQAKSELLGMPRAKLHMFYAFHHARSRDVERGAPKIPVDQFVELIPEEIRADVALEEAFLDVCLSDGAWELYQLHVDPTPVHDVTH